MPRQGWGRGVGVERERGEPSYSGAGGWDVGTSESGTQRKPADGGPTTVDDHERRSSSSSAPPHDMGAMLRPHESAEPTVTVLVSVGLALAAYSLVAALVPQLAPHLVNKGLCGKDMLKPGFRRAEPALEQEAKVRRGDDNEDPQDDDLPGNRQMCARSLPLSKGLSVLTPGASARTALKRRASSAPQSTSSSSPSLPPSLTSRTSSPRPSTPRPSPRSTRPPHSSSSPTETPAPPSFSRGRSRSRTTRSRPTSRASSRS